MTISQNGWTAYADTSNFTRFTAAGRGWWAANADVAVVAAEFIERFNATVEAVVRPGEQLDDWSYANRLVRGSTTAVSNHGSATAWDLNATRHPRGVRGTFTAAQAAQMRRIRNEITDAAGSPVLRLGMDFTTTVDDMHVEINANATRVKQAANKIRARHQEDDGMATITPAQFAELLAETKIELTEAAAAEMSTTTNPRKKGDKVSLSYVLQWGGAGAYREWAEVKAVRGAVKSLTAQVGSQAGVIAALADALKTGGSLTEAQARAAGEAGASAALAKLGEALDGSQ